MMKTISAVVLAALLPGAAVAQTVTVPREAAYTETVSVTGVGRSSVMPDRVTFTAGVETIAPTVDAASRQNTESTAAVIAALKKGGIQDKEIRTSNFSIFPQQEYLENRRPRIIGFQVTNSVTVTRDKVDGVGKFLQAAIDAGANQVSGISFSVADPTKGRNEGLRAAYLDARAKAELLAVAAGRPLGRALAITEGGAAMPPQPPMYGKAMAMGSRVSADVPIEQGSDELRFTVSVIFELR